VRPQRRWPPCGFSGYAVFAQNGLDTRTRKDHPDLVVMLETPNFPKLVVFWLLANVNLPQSTVFLAFPASLIGTSRWSRS
jgi:hypothetical protein